MCSIADRAGRDWRGVSLALRSFFGGAFAFVAFEGLVELPCRFAVIFVEFVERSLGEGSAEQEGIPERLRELVGLVFWRKSSPWVEKLREH